MRSFLGDDFLLQSKTANQLYHEFAEEMPIIDYHCHLPPSEIAEDKQFENLTQVWLYGDHYKWRAMRTNGVDESYCTGNKSDWEKFEKWAETVPYTLRNPLYHWTHLELLRYFNVHTILNPKTAKEIYEACNEKLRTRHYSVKNLLKKMNVRLVCTTDDPADDLQFHRQLKNEGFEIPVLPAFRPDSAIRAEDTGAFLKYLLTLENVANISIASFKDYIDVLKSRHDFFAENGCSVADHGLEEIYANDFTDREIKTIFEKLLGNKSLDQTEIKKFKSAMLLQFAEWNHAKGWVQQYHLGALRNNNSRMTSLVGPNTGWDSIGDFPQAVSLAKFLDRLERKNQLAKTILYNVNPAYNEVMATMTGNFNDGSIAGKIQWGSAWWFLDQADGIKKQLNTLSNMGLISRFVGMLTDSRSFLSFPRHEYFRRLLCNLFGEEIDSGELPDDIGWTGKIIRDICYFNAKNYFNWQGLQE